MASVPLATPIASWTPRYAADSCSKALTFGPRMKAPDSRTSSILARISARNGVYCALTLISGIATRSQCSGSPTAQNPPTDQSRGHDEHDRDVDVAEVAVQLLVARADPPADRTHPERDARAADQGAEEEAAEGQADDPARDRDERAQQRGGEADGHGDELVALEPG